MYRRVVPLIPKLLTRQLQNSCEKAACSRSLIVTYSTKLDTKRRRPTCTIKIYEHRPYLRLLSQMWPTDSGDCPDILKLTFAKRVIADFK